jgi:hypothetical protein
MYAARKGDKWFVVLDGQAGPEYDEILEGTPVFSSDGKRVAYGAGKGGKRFVVIDGQEGTMYDGIRNLVFSPDGKHLAYGAGKGDKQLVVLDGQPVPDYDGVLISGSAFRPDGTVEYLAGKAGTLFRVKHVPVEK